MDEQNGFSATLSVLFIITIGLNERVYTFLIGTFIEADSHRARQQWMLMWVM